MHICFQEQRTHIDVLDSALSSAQNNVLRLEEELRQKDAYADRVKQMTKSLEQLQVKYSFTDIVHLFYFLLYNYIVFS